MMNIYQILLAAKIRTASKAHRPSNLHANLRYLSVTPLKSAFDEDKQESASCPVTGLSRNPTLTKVPSLPFLGTLFHLYSGTPKFNSFDIYNYHAECRKRFGDFYTIGFPGYGTGSHGTVHVTTDPNEMAKVIRSEGAYPSGLSQKQWMILKDNKDKGSALVDGDDHGIFDSGLRWKRHRRFLNTGMLDPKAIKRFVPGIQEAARLASNSAPARRNDLSLYLSHCTFDMYNTFMFGELTRCADRSASKEGNDENIQFCEAAMTFLSLIGEFQINPYHSIMVEKLGIKTKKCIEFEEASGVVDAIGMKKIRAFIERYERGVLNDAEKSSYLAGAIERQAAEDSEISKEEMMALCISTLIAAVDTTSSIIAWCLVHLAVHQNVQEALYAELSTNSSANGGHLTEKVVERATFPYLHAVYRETIRITPIFHHRTVKSTSHSDINVHGITFPKGTTFALDNIVNDVRYFPDADQFKPERWFSEAIEARKGTPSMILDHPFFRDQFGQGARRCPGSRIATNEVLCMVSQLVLDYQIVAREKSLSEIVYESRLFIQPLKPVLEFIRR